MAYKINSTTVLDYSLNDYFLKNVTFQNLSDKVSALGTLSSGTTNITITGVSVLTATLPTSGTVTFDFPSASNGRVTIAPAGGALSFTLILTNPASGTPTIAFGTSGQVVFQGDNTVPSYDTTANRVHIWTFTSINQGTNWFGALVQDNIGPSTTSLVARYHYAKIDAIYQDSARPDIAGTGSEIIDAYTGIIGGTGSSAVQDAIRWGGWTPGTGSGGNRIFEWKVLGSWGSSDGFVGLLDSAHWNANPYYGGSTGERAMLYLGGNSAYGENTGTTISNYNATYSTLTTAGDICGACWNNSNQKLNLYKNGNLICTLTNSSLGVSSVIYPCVQGWYGAQFDLHQTLLVYPSSYASSYTLPA